MAVLGGGAVSYARGTPVERIPRGPDDPFFFFLSSLLSSPELRDTQVYEP